MYTSDSLYHAVSVKAPNDLARKYLISTVLQSLIVNMSQSLPCNLHGHLEFKRIFCCIAEVKQDRNALCRCRRDKDVCFVLHRIVILSFVLLFLHLYYNKNA